MAIKAVAANIRHLRAFREVARRRSISQAAEQIHLSQPAITQAIAKLESQIGTPLFERRFDGMPTTVAGALFLDRVDRMLECLRCGTREAVRVGDRKAARGFADFDQLLTAAQLRALWRSAARPAPRRDRCADRRVARSGPYRRRGAGGAVHRPSGRRARAFHPLTRRPAVTPGDLAANRWVVPRPGTPTRTLFDALFESQGLPIPTGVVEASSLQLIRGLLLGSDMLTLISLHQIRHERDLGLLVPLPVALPGSERPIGLTLRCGWRPTATQERFLAFL